MDAPFYIGQEVVSLFDLIVEGTDFIKKGTDYIIQAQKQCNCGLWLVQVGVNLSCFDGIRCLRCGTCRTDMSNVWLSSRGFAPKIELSETTFEQVMEWVKDKNPVTA